MYRTLLEDVWLNEKGANVMYRTNTHKTLSHTPSSNVRYIAFAMRKNASRSHCTARNL